MENSSLDNNTVRIFLNPEFTNINPTLAIVLIALCISIIYFYKSIHNNWDSFKCNPIIMLFFSIFNSNSENSLQQCLKRTQSEAVYNSVQHLQEEIGTINAEIAALKSGDDGSNSQQSISGDPLHNLSITVQQNIISVKNAISKIMGAFVLSTYMTQGALTTTQSLADNEIVTAVSVVNKIPKDPPVTMQIPNFPGA